MITAFLKGEAHSFKRALLAIAKGSITAVLGSICLAVLASLNAHIFTEIPWCVVVMVAVCAAAILVSVRNRALLEFRLGTLRAAIVALVLTAALGVAAIVLTGVSNVFTGTARLPGDRIAGPEILRSFVSIGSLASAAVIEEAAMRGQIQLQLQRLYRPIVAELIADAVFVILHVMRLGNPREAILVCLLSLTGGRVTKFTQSIRWSATIHLGTNLIIASTVLWNRA